jgi:hypothetical protein
MGGKSNVAWGIDGASERDRTSDLQDALDEAKVLVEARTKAYNPIRPHGSLGSLFKQP